MPARLHRPQRRVPLDRLLEEVQAGLAAALPRDPALPPTWEPAHGDLTPWNLRRSAHQRRQPVALIDWEGAGWAPPGADRVYFRAVESVVFGAPVQAGPIEAVEYWLERARRRPASDYDGKFNARLVAVLQAMAAG
jgi:aminoglycoside phosphotransferase (APT) family kinase protein